MVDRPGAGLDGLSADPKAIGVPPGRRVGPAPRSRGPLLAWALGLGLSLGSGVLLALSAPPSKASPLAFVALVPLFHGIRKLRAGPALLFGFVCGFTYYSLGFQWVGAFHRYALAFASAISGFFFVALPISCARPLLKRGAWGLVAIPSIWVLFEFVKQAWPLAFPFGILGYSQFTWPLLVQVSDLGGVYLVSWLVVFANAALFRASLSLGSKGAVRRRVQGALPFLAAAGLALALPCLYGAVRLSGLSYEAESRFKIGFAQTLFDSRETWTDREAENLASIESSFAALAGVGARLVLFPELSVDRLLSYDPSINIPGGRDILNRLSALARNSGTGLLIGSLEAKAVGGTERTYNAMQLFDGSGNLAGIYRKSKLVPFGETNPFGRLFPSLSGYLARTTDSILLDPGEKPQLFPIPDDSGRIVRFGALICFESCFGSLSASYARQGADFLVAATSDFWSLSSIAMYQHAAMAMFRAVENRLPVMQISNGGFSCYIDERGAYSTTLPIFRRGVMTSRLYLLKDRRLTLYARLGDWFVWACGLLTALAAIAALASSPVPRRRRPRPPKDTA